jgi:hypothetical protein
LPVTKMSSCSLNEKTVDNGSLVQLKVWYNSMIMHLLYGDFFFALHKCNNQSINQSIK